MAWARGAPSQRPDDGRLSASRRHERLFPRRRGGWEEFDTPGAVPLYAVATDIAGGAYASSGYLAGAAGRLCPWYRQWVVDVGKFQFPEAGSYR